MIIEIPREKIADTIKERGWIQGEYGDGDNGPVCLHGAVRLCCPVPGDAYIVEQVDKARGYGTGWNDKDGRTRAGVLRHARCMPDITDNELSDLFGPQWDPIVQLVRRAAILTPEEGDKLRAARHAAWGAAWGAAWEAAWEAAGAAARAAAWEAAWEAAWAAARAAAREAARAAACALVVRDRIGSSGFEQHHYDLLTGPWRRVIGPVHPDDAEIENPSPLGEAADASETRNADTNGGG